MLEGQLEELNKAMLDHERKKLEIEFQNLADKEILRENLPKVKQEIERLYKIKKLDKCISETGTQAITKLGNEIADEVITSKLRDRFQQEIVKLAAEKVRVEIIRSGGKYGSPQYRISLLAKPDAKISFILVKGGTNLRCFGCFLNRIGNNQS